MRQTDIHLPRPGRLEDQTWRTRAACRGVDTNVFYVGNGVMAERAKAICAQCEVRTECLAECMALGGEFWEFGIWGGLTGNDRRALRRRAVTGGEIEHGTRTGFALHRMDPEQHGRPCEACAEAEKAYQAERYRREKAKKEEAA